MAIQARTFSPLPPQETILARISEQQGRTADPTSYIWYIAPVAERFGSRVFQVAAEALSRRGVHVTAEELEKLAQELNTSEGKDRYAAQRRSQIASITSIKVGDGAASVT